MLTQPHSDWSRRAFTLVELLASLAIMVILAAVAVAGFSRMGTSAQIARSVSNQTAIAKAVMLYHADKGVLPGPTFNSVSAPEYQQDLPESEQIKNLRRLLRDYIPERKDAWLGSNPLTAANSTYQVVFMLNNRVTTQPSRFFGYPGSTAVPLRMMQIEAAGRPGTPGFEAKSPGKIWMMADADNLNCSFLPAGDKRFDPVNGGRVYVFFDGHAEFRKDNDRPANADSRGP
jgi:prepilin-type N-terminal cleavage/methylation domain-containing protein/prepilin-type processing-associated H-X9-DG protein